MRSRCSRSRDSRARVRARARSRRRPRAGRTFRARGDMGAIFHPGGLQWWLRRLGLPGFELAVLANDREVVGLALRDGGDVIVQTDPEHTGARAELLEWVEGGARASR